jgi:Raf kinase inhibitor-like YbhB/YbcL family protein
MTRTHSITALAATLLAAGALNAGCQAGAPPAAEAGAAQLALVTLPAKGGTKLTVTSPAFAMSGDIPFENTQYRGNVFPGLAWSAGPAATKSYAIIMQDGDAMRQGAPILHWTMANIPATVTKLDAAMSAPPAGASYGPNIRGANQAYMGPHTPAGPKHRYHIQLFALDTTLPEAALADYASLTAAMTDHVLASGELIGLGQAPPS